MTVSGIPGTGILDKPVLSGSESASADKSTKLTGLILAQNERWRRGLGMQVAREAN